VTSPIIATVGAGTTSATQRRYSIRYSSRRGFLRLIEISGNAANSDCEIGTATAGNDVELGDTNTKWQQRF